MPVCRHCGSRITKFDKDRCPVCGEINPLEGVNSDTIEITSEIDLSNSEFMNFKPKKRLTLLVLALTCGWTSAHLFYLGYKKAGFIWLGINLAVFAILFSIFFFGISSLLLGILIPILTIYLMNAIFGVFLFKNPNLKDSNENLLR